MVQSKVRVEEEQRSRQHKPGIEVDAVKEAFGVLRADTTKLSSTEKVLGSLKFPLLGRLKMVAPVGEIMSSELEDVRNEK